MPKGDNQPNKRCSDSDFLNLFESLGPAKTSRQLGVSLRNVYTRRDRLEAKLGRQVVSGGENKTRHAAPHPNWLKYEVSNGVVLVGSDAHVWPGPLTTAMRGFIHFAKKLQPKIIAMNGDVLDGASISRHPPIGWASLPTLEQEIEACQEALKLIERAAPNAKRVWPLGNHDSRLEVRLATVAPEFAKVHGTSLKDHFPYWRPCWSMIVNDEVVIKHRFKGGAHATYTNTLHAGKTMVTGHLHSLRVTPFTDYRSTRFGVDCGTLADIHGAPFEDYMEHNPRSWRSGFVVLTFRDGRLMWPEIAHVIGDGEMEFRSEIVRV